MKHFGPPDSFDAMLVGDDSHEAVAARLERVRDILGVTKREFAKSAGISEQTYGNLINHHRGLSLPAAKLLRKNYALSLDFIYFGNKADLPHRIANHL